MNDINENTAPASISFELMKMAFDAPNNRSIFFTPVYNEEKEIIDFRFTLLSRGTIDFFNGIDRTGQTLMEILPDQIAQIGSLKKAFLDNEPQNWVRYYENLDGKQQWFKVSDSKVGNGVFRVWEDITEQKVAEKKLNALLAEQIEDKYLSLFNSVDQGFCIIEVIFDENNNATDYRFIKTNPAFEKQTGLKDAIGKTMKEIEPNHEKHWFEIYGEIAKTGKPRYFEQEAKELINGWYEVSAFPLNEELNNKVAVIFNDITARKNVQKELSEFNSRLEEEVRERTASLEKVNSLLEQKNIQLENSNRELESFNYIASHDLQEPLRKIQTFISFIKDRDMSREEAEPYIKKIHSSAGRMTQLIKDVLVYSRLSVEKEFVDVNLNDILDNVIADYELLIKEKKAKIEKSWLPTIKAIPLQMEQLFSNLISNSLKYSSEKPVITISHEINPLTNTIHLIFSDNGIGFDAQYSEQIFKLFQRLHGKGDYAGTGIGLSICKKIVEQHRGTISAKSQPGNGATFNITLPLN
ncbi:ATP-binding protein [Flavobacterium beibuense]|uniref:histidine kinase n=1 Tax=Flavobacterium beibuense TaxID=657326 RepID=A0A444WAR4_9FLAO|nr:ATP-binding protein [Flavobacterium beibuense]RYJ42907.1 Multi-sensor signal transduction histidine kinase [Flavobacterium beibuense]